MAAERRVRVVVQSRVGSSRLPGKALLEIGGHPMCVLVALRAANRGHDVVVATSVESDDDLIEQAVAARGIRVVRGPLADTLARFVVATRDLADDDVVVRLTADNIVPDGDLVAEAVGRYDRSGGYVHVSHLSDRVPYGVSAEVFGVGALRRADRHATTAFDREHVTPFIRREAGAVTAAAGSATSAGRCTVDTADDFLVAARILAGVADPVGIGWRALAALFTAETGAPQVPRRDVTGRVESALILGTAQLGLDYGIANESGMPSVRDGQELLRAAVAHGITHLDTAAAYGAAETRIGAFLDIGYRDRLSVVTKIAPFDQADVADPDAAVRTSLLRSVARLGASPDPASAPAVDTVLFHRASDAVIGWDALRGTRDAGLVDRIGVSVQHPAEALRVLRLPGIQALQVPFNLLDARWGEVAARVLDAGVAVHARSVFLQGLLTGRVPAARWPRADGFDAEALLSALTAVGASLGRADIASLALAHVRAQPWISSIVVGCESRDQLDDLVTRLTEEPLTVDEAEEVSRAVGEVPVAVLDPSRWDLPGGREEPS